MTYVKYFNADKITGRNASASRSGNFIYKFVNETRKNKLGTQDLVSVS